MNVKTWLIVCCLAATCAADDELPIIAHWSFDDDTAGKLIDSGPSELHAELKHGDAKHATYVDGRVGKALSLAADHRCKFVLPNSPKLDIKPPFTIAAWIRRTSDKPTSTEILCKLWDSGTAGYRLRYGWRMLNFRWGDGNEAFSLSSPGNTIMKGKWYHVAATHDGKAVKLFINTEEVASVESDAAPAKENSQAVIGNFMGTPEAYPFVGQIVELCIIGKAMTSDELFELAEPEEKKDES